ncbi:MAG: diacylglycerol kinase family lipid kinase [Anaerolineae bacterium]|nr:diacylglycerol kinase family lipid kinase [Anaerolineae bacterium]
MTKTLIILNPHAGSGRAGKLWTEVEPLLWELLGELVVAITQHPEEVALHLDKAYASGLTRVISIGGDGTNHALVNALADLNARNPDGPPMIYGNLPIGSGRDWARHQQIPMDIRQAARWIAEAKPQPTDIGLLTFNQKRKHFLNIASAGLSGEVDRRVNNQPVRRPWTFLQATVSSILQHQPQQMQVTVDGEEWFEGEAYLVAVANGSTFGHGMKIAPHAQTDDGLFEVVLVKGVSRPRILSALYRVYDGSHLTHPAVLYRRAQDVRILGHRASVGLDLDGEHASGSEMHFSIRPGLLHMLM